MSTFLGSSTSNILIDDNQIVLTNNSVPVMTISDSNSNVDFGTYSLTNFGQFQQDLNMGNFKIVNLAQGTLDTDVSTRGYVNQKVAELVNSAPEILDTLSEIASSLNNDPSFAVTIANQLSLKFNTADFNSTFATRYGLTSITDALPQTGDYSANSFKLTDVADPTLAQDAATKNYVDTQMTNAQDLITTASGDNKVQVSDTGDLTTFTNGTSTSMFLDNVSLRPQVPIDMQTLKVTNLQYASASDDAMAFGQDLRNHLVHAQLSANLTTPFGATYTIPFNQTISPAALVPAVTPNVTHSAGTFSLLPGKFMVKVALCVEYVIGTNQPVVIQLTGSVNGVSPYMNVISNRASALNTAVLTQMSAVLDVTVAEDFTINLTNTTRLSLINRNTNVTIEQIA